MRTCVCLFVCSFVCLCVVEREEGGERQTDRDRETTSVAAFSVPSHRPFEQGFFNFVIQSEIFFFFIKIGQQSINAGGYFLPGVRRLLGLGFFLLSLLLNVAQQ